MTRRSLTRLQRVRIFDAAFGVCHFCETKIQAERGDAWDVSHTMPLEAGGADEPDNMRPAHRACHKAHTAAVDAPLIAKVHRQRASHLGIKKRSGFQTNRTGSWRKRMDGTVERRTP